MPKPEIKIEKPALEHERIQDSENLADGYNTEILKRNPVQVLMHSPMGLQIDWNISESRLEIWISPQAKQSTDAFLRNFSNRDDHTRVFDRITLPGLRLENFERCDYDPFHSVLHYAGGVRIHLLALVDDPAVVLWAEGAGLLMDFKSDKQDSPGERDERQFVVRHPDRGLTLDFAAILGSGEQSGFTHQLMDDPGRSTYARARVGEGVPVIIGGELEKEQVAESLARLADRSVEELLRENEAKVTRATSAQHAVFRESYSDWQAQYDLNKRILYSGMDHGGWIPAALRSLYYLCWHFDGSIISSWLGCLGWPDFAERFARFSISNPTETETPVPGKFFGQLVTRCISKQEEWGWYCAVWAAFTDFSQTGSRQFATGQFRQNLLETLDWLERACWDDDWQAFGFYYTGEDPFIGSNDFGYDAAVGNPQTTHAPSIEGQAITRMYAFNRNHYMFNGYLMLAAMVETDDPALAQTCREKAARLEPFLRRCLEEEVYAFNRVEGGSVIPDKQPPHHELAAFFSARPATLPQVLDRYERVTVAQVKEGRERFAHQVFNALVQRDPLLQSSYDELEDMLEIYIPQCRREGRFQRMGGAPIENVNCEDGSYHDNRPQMFATSLMNTCILSTGIRRQAFGYAVRPSRFLERLENIRFLGKTLNFVFTGNGEQIRSLTIGETSLRYTLQLPENLLRETTEITVGMDSDRPAHPQWIASSLRLLSVDEGGATADRITWSAEAFGRNHVTILGEPRNLQVISEENDTEIPHQTETTHGATFLEFPGRGRVKITCST